MRLQILAIRDDVPLKVSLAAACHWRQHCVLSQSWARRYAWITARWYACMRARGACVSSHARRISSSTSVIFTVRLKVSRVSFVAINIRTVTVCVYTPTSITTPSGIRAASRWQLATAMTVSASTATAVPATAAVTACDGTVLSGSFLFFHRTRPGRATRTNEC